MKIKEFLNEMVTSVATGTDNMVFQRLFTKRLNTMGAIKFIKDKKKKKRSKV